MEEHEMEVWFTADEWRQFILYDCKSFYDALNFLSNHSA